jgi:hypothetical protein
MSLHFSLESRFLGEIASCTDFMFETEDTLWVSKCGAVVECRKVNLKPQVHLQAVLLLRVWGNVFIPKKFDPCKIMSEKFDIYNKNFFRDVGNFFRHLCILVLRHQMRVSNYFVNSFYSVPNLHLCDPFTCGEWPCLMLLPTGGQRVEIFHITLFAAGRMTKSDSPIHWRPKGRALSPTLYSKYGAYCTCGGWPSLVLLHAGDQRVGHWPTVYMWSSMYLWRMTQSDAPTHWRPKGRSLPHLHLCDPCTCEGWPCLMLLPKEAEGKVITL